MKLVSSKVSIPIRQSKKVATSSTSFNVITQRVFSLIRCYCQVSSTIDRPHPEFLKFYTDEMNRR